MTNCSSRSMTPYSEISTAWIIKHVLKQHFSRYLGETEGDCGVGVNVFSGRLGWSLANLLQKQAGVGALSALSSAPALVMR